MMRIVLFVSAVFCLSYCISYGQEPYKPYRITDDIVLDGKLDEQVWQLTPSEDAFMQQSPQAGAAATEKTIYRIVYNDDYLYVGITCFDTEPDNLTRLALNRDYALGDDDGTGLIIDTYRDKTTGLGFLANTLDARWDATFSQDGTSSNDSYNTYWDAVTAIQPYGYSTEYRIPFSSLRFETKSEVIMGIRISRMIKRKNELITSPPCDPSTQGAWSNLSFAREVVFTNLVSRTPFYISPYAIANFNRFNILNADSTAYVAQTEFMQRKNFDDIEIVDKIISNIGIDAKYGITKNLTLDLTLNTDFAQAEVDDRIINLSKYEVNLPEKRSFFLESANNLSFGFPSGNTLFISRKIGRENGLIVPIIGGARLTGKANGWQMGALNMQTLGIADEGISPHNFTVLRTRKDIDSLGSFVGGIITNKINTDTSNTSNQSVGLDFVKRFNQQFTVEGGVASTLINLQANDFIDASYLHLGVFKSAVTGFTYNSTLDFLGKEIRPDMGFIDDNNYGNSRTQLTYRVRLPESSKLQYMYLISTNNYRWRFDTHKRETHAIDLWPGVQFKNGMEINFSLFEYKIDSLPFDWELDENNAIAAGTYTNWNNSLEIYSPSQSALRLALIGVYGGFYSGQKLTLMPNINYYINAHLNFSLYYEFNNINFDTYLTDTVSTQFVSNLIRWNVTYNFTTKVSLRFYVQYDDLSDLVSANLRFRYNPKEGTDLFIVYNQGTNTDVTRLDPHLPVVDNQAVTVKFIKTFEL